MGGHGQFRVTNQEDVLPSRTLLLVAVITAAVFTAGGLLAWAFLARYEHTYPPKSVEPVLMTREIHMVDQSLIWVDQSIDDWMREERLQLDSYGWVDRDNGIAHIPIEEAMQRVVRGERP